MQQQTFSRSRGPDGTRFHHLTLNTSHVTMQARADVGDAVIAILWPLVQGGGGPLPGMPGWFLDVRFPQDARGERIPGRAFFQVANQPRIFSRPPMMAVACWRDEASAGAWAQATDAYCQMGAPIAKAPPPTPWLAAWLTPTSVTVDPAVLFVFGDLERCVAWTLAED